MLIMVVCLIAVFHSWRTDKAVREETGSFTAAPVPDEVFTRMQGKSYPKGCTVRREDLRYLRLLHYGTDGKVHEGEMICHKSIAGDLTEIFRELYRQHYPIGSIRLIDDFDADDERSMRANNTTCFCYRKVAGSSKLSKHAQGLAVDINPLYNPYGKKRADGTMRVQPATGRKYLDRNKDFPCKITRSDAAYLLFVRHGFRWGGAWRSLKDYQHFEK